MNKKDIFPSNNDIDNIITILKSLNDKTRLKIIFALIDGDKHVNELVELVGPSQSAISHQLRFLRDTNIIVANKQGNRVMYSIADDHVEQLVELCLIHAQEA